MSRARHAFTLFEVAVALAVLTVAVTSSLALFTHSLRAHRLARFQLYASAKAVELVECYMNGTNTVLCVDIEAPQPWDLPVNYRSTAPDLEARVATRRFGAAALPTDIARRLDSDGDEMQRILDAGGQLLYALPQAPTAWDESALPRNPPSDAQSLVFAVAGYPQANALFSFPGKAWPYYTPFPGPPMVVHHARDFATATGPDPDASSYLRFGMPGMADYRLYLWEETSDPDIRTVLQWPTPEDPKLDRNFGWMPYAYPRQPYALPSIAGSPCDQPTADGALRYVQAALWYAQAKGLPASFWTGTATLTDFVAGDAWKQVQAMRFLSHAATCLTRWHDQVALTAGVAIPAIDLGAGAGMCPALLLKEAHVLAYEASALALMHRYRTTRTYDWSAPRAYENALFTDWPLLEPDLFSPPLRGTIGGAPAIAAAQWRPIAPRPVTGVGRSMSHPGAAIDGSVWGDARHVTLTAPFTADERCRQLVFWAVDWRAYEDAETAPSAAIDASRYPKAAPGFDAGGSPWPFTSLMEASDLPWVDVFLTVFRNPELPCVFTRDVAAVATGSAVAADRASVNLFATPDRGVAGLPVFTGAHGADRDFDGVLDRGPVPMSARLRATTVARFNFYDLRVPFSLR